MQESLGFSTYGFRIWGKGRRDECVFLFRRVLEHSSIYGLACLDHVLRHVDKAATQQVILWSDGPRMFKSNEYLAGSFGLLQTRPNVMKVSHNYGFPKHVRGTHDGMFGVAKHVFEDAIRALPDGIHRQVGGSSCYLPVEPVEPVGAFNLNHLCAP